VGYKVVLVNLGKSVDDATQKKVTALLGGTSGFFTQVVTAHDAKYNKGTKLTSADIVWTDAVPSVTNTELIVYFVRNASDSVIKHMQGSKGAGTEAGITFPDVGTPVGSEVYVQEANKGTDLSGDLAAITFHEAMHNKLRWGDAKLHGKDGGGGLAAATISSTTTLTATNIDIMAQHLADNVPQWADGVTEYANPLNGHI